MKRFYSATALLLLLFPLIASAVVKLDIDGREMAIAITEGTASGGLRPEHPEWAKPSENYLIFAVPGRAPSEWTKFQCTFTPGRDGEVDVSRRGLYSQPEIKHWVLYRNFHVAGAEVILHRRAKVNTMTSDPTVERSGHYHGIVDTLAVAVGQPVTLEFEAMRGITEDAAKYSPEEVLRPAKPASKWNAIQVLVDGTAAGIMLKSEASNADFQVESDVRDNKTIPGRLLFSTPRIVGPSWKKYELSFTPDIGGDIALHRQNRLSDYSTLSWIEFRNFKISGGTLRRHRSAPVNATSDPQIERGAYRATIYDIITVESDVCVQVEFEARNAISEPYQKYPAKSFWLQQPDYKIAWQDKNIQLLSSEDKGATFAIYKANNEHLDLPRPLFRNPKGAPSAMEMVSIPVEILEEDGVARTAEIRFGFPLPEKMFHDLKSLRVLSPAGSEVPAQFSALGFWGDQSIKWTLVEFLMPLQAREKAVFRVEAGKDVHPMPVNSPIVVTENTGIYSISTGPLACCIKSNSPTLADEIIVNGKNFGSLLPRLLDENNKPANAKHKRILIEEQGNLAVTFRIDGEFIGDRRPGGYTARLRFFANSTIVKLVFTYRADDLSNEMNDLTALSLNLTCGKGSLASGTSKIFQPEDTVFYLDSVAKEGFMPETGLFKSPLGDVSFGLTDAGKRYPKAFAATAEGLDIQLLPEQPTKDFNSHLPGYLRFPFSSGKYRLMAGMNFTEELVFDFSGSAVSANEVIPVVDRAWQARTGAIAGVSTDHFSLPFDTRALEAFYEHLKRKQTQREYGFLNWGDWFGERGGNWGNNEYDFAFGLFTLFIRTGNRDVYRLAMAAARHQSDVDIIHATPFPEFLGGNHMHCVGHTGMRYEPNKEPKPWFGGQPGLANPANGHSWCGGMFTAWLLAGKADIADSALLLANHFKKGSSKPYQNQGNPRSHGWMLEGLMQAFEAIGDPEYLNAATKVADGFFKVQNFEKGGAWAYKLPPGYARGHQDAFGNSCFQMGIVAQALLHYTNRAKRPEINKNLSAISAWLRAAWSPAAIGWPYVALWDSTPLWPPNSTLNMLILPGAYADGNPKGFEMVQTALRFIMLKGLSMDGVGKDLAMDLVFAPALFELIKQSPNSLTFNQERFLEERAEAPRQLQWRGPDHKELEIELLNSNATLYLERNFYNRRPNGKDNFSYLLSDPSGTKISTFEGAVEEKKLQHKIPLQGKIGDVFKLVIDDDMTSFWEADCGNDAIVHVKLVPGSQFGKGFPLFFTLRVPSGTKTFTVHANASHPGLYGIILADSTGKIVSFESRKNNHTMLPWLEKASPKPQGISLTIHCENFALEQTYTLLTWSQGDIVLGLDGIPPYLEYTAK